MAARRTRPRIAVLGAGGFIGSHLVPALLNRLDCTIDAVDLTFDKLAPTDRRVNRIRSSIETKGLLEALTKAADVVVSLTAMCNPALYNTRPLDVIQSNFTHLLPLVDLCASRKRHLVHFSTSEVYGRAALNARGRPAVLMDEATTPMYLGPIQAERWTYACAKQLLERVIWAQGQHGLLPFTIIRPFNVLGARMDYLPGVDGEGVPRVLASFMNALLRGEDLLLVDGGRRRRSFVAIDEFIEAVVRVVADPAACRGQILNLGNPQNDVSIRALGRSLSKEYARQVPGAAAARFRTVTGAALYGPGYDDAEARIPDIRRAQRLLKWRPRITLAQMLPGIVRDYLDRYRSVVAKQMEHAG